MSDSLHSLALLARERGDLEQAESLLHETLALEKRIVPGGVRTAITLRRLAEVALARRRWDEAELHLAAALPIWERLQPDSFGEGQTRYLRGRPPRARPPAGSGGRAAARGRRPGEPDRHAGRAQRGPLRLPCAARRRLLRRPGGRAGAAPARAGGLPGARALPGPRLPGDDDHTRPGARGARAGGPGGRAPAAGLAVRPQAGAAGRGGPHLEHGRGQAAGRAS